nr:hypothetical protein [Buchnera aphidicola]
MKQKKINIYPWFVLKNKIIETTKYTIIFGHWASIRGQGTPRNIIGLDTGCCWNGCLTALRWEDKKFFSQNCL